MDYKKSIENPDGAFIDFMIIDSQHAVCHFNGVIFMKKIIAFIGLTICTTAFALPKGADPSFFKQAQALMDQQSKSYGIADTLLEASLDRDLTASETEKYNQATCNTVAAEAKFADLLLSNLVQAKLFLEEDQLTTEDISKMRTASISYEAANELVGTTAECK